MKVKTVYKVVNPSDAYTIEASDLEVAAVACILLGRGQYALEPLEGELKEVPFFMFGKADEWFGEHFGADVKTTLDRVMGARSAELADCLDSCLIGNLAARREYERALELIESPENREKFRRERHDKRRGSMNDIGGRAYEMARRLRENAANPVVTAPQQVFSE
jgi:hypothetical protein